MKIANLALCIPFLLAGCSGGGEEGHVCGPCGMTMDAGSEHTSVDGMEFVFCSEKCEEVVSENPKDYAEFAIQH